MLQKGFLSTHLVPLQAENAEWPSSLMSGKEGDRSHTGCRTVRTGISCRKDAHGVEVVRVGYGKYVRDHRYLPAVIIESWGSFRRLSI